VTGFAVRGSVINELIHVAAALYAVLPVTAGLAAGRFGATFVINAVAVAVNAALVALQRYNRARMVRAADRFLASGHGYRADHRNWAGLDRRALQRYHGRAAEVKAHGAGRFVLNHAAILGGTLTWFLLDVVADLEPRLRRLLPEPFDLFSHAGNLKGGAIVAVAALVVRQAVARIRTGSSDLSQRQVRSFRRIWVPAVVGITAAVSAMTETRWGVDLVGHRLFPGTTPDPLDLVHSAVFGGVLAALGWRRATGPARGSDTEHAVDRDVLRSEIERARADLDAVVSRLLLSRSERRAASRALQRGLRRYWGQPGMSVRNVHVPHAARRLVDRLEARADLRLSESERVEIAVRLMYWSTATARYPAGHGKDRVDVGDQVRDAVTAAFVEMLPAPLRSGLALDGRHLRQVYDDLLHGEPGGGAVALTPLTEADRLVIVDALLEQQGRMTPLAQLPHRMPRGPPGVEVLVLDGELPVPGVIAFGWADGRAVVITRRMLDELSGHLAAGRLDPDWWTALLVHERDFHLPGGHVLEHTGHRHDQDAARLVEVLHRARAQRSEGVPEVAGAGGAPADDAPGAAAPPPSRAPAVSVAAGARRGQVEPTSPMTGAGGARSPPAATVKIWYEKPMPRREFRWKAERLLELSADGRLTKAHNPVARNRNVTRKYRHDLVERIEQVIRPHDPELADRLVRRVTVQMSADHVHELQLGGPDDAENLRMLDRLTNEVIGARQIQPQIHALPDGTPVRIEVVDIAELARRVARAVREDGRLTYLELVQRCAVSQAELRGAVRSDDSLRDVRHRAVEQAGDEEGADVTRGVAAPGRIGTTGGEEPNR
jgi:hypothetical protein